MFMKAEKDKPETPKPQETTSVVETTTQNLRESKEVKAVIGPSITIKGELVGKEDIVLQGRVEGTITLKQNSLIVSQQGSVKADVKAEKVTVEGRVEGDIHGEESVLVRASGNVQGNIIAPRVSLEEGGSGNQSEMICDGNRSNFQIRQIQRRPAFFQFSANPTTNIGCFCIEINDIHCG